MMFRFPFSIERSTPGFVRVGGDVALTNDKRRERAILNRCHADARYDLAYLRGQKNWRINK